LSFSINVRRNRFAADMSVIIILISASLIVSTGFLVSFLWAVKTKQFEDDYTPSVRILFEDKPGEKEIPSEKNII